MITKGERRLRGINWETDIDVYTILYIKQIIKTYFTAQGSLWYSVMISMGMESGREWIYACIWLIRASLVTQLIKNLPATWETWVRKIPWRRERLPTPVFWPGKSQGLSMELQRVGHSWVTFTFHFSSCYNLCKVLKVMPDINIRTCKLLSLLDTCMPLRQVSAWLCHFGSVSTSIKKAYF